MHIELKNDDVVIEMSFCINMADFYSKEIMPVLSFNMPCTYAINFCILSIQFMKQRAMSPCSRINACLCLE